MFVLLSLVFLGCDKEEENSDRIVIGTPSRIKKLDPMSSNDIPSLLVTNQIFDTFFIYDNKEIKSNILDGYSFVDGNLEIIPKKDLKFSNGDSVSIEDFKNSLERAIKNPACEFLIGNIDKVEIVGDKIIISFKVPTPSIVNNLTYPMVVLLKETDKGLVGTGSFKLENDDIESIELVPNDYSKKPGKNKLLFKAILEDNSRTIALETKEIHINTSVTPLDKELLKSKGVEIVETPSVTTEMIWFNDKKLNLNERIKITNAVNKNDILSTSIEGDGVVATSMVPESSYGFVPNTLEKKDSDAKIERVLKIVLNDNGARKTNAQIIQANLKSVGIESEIIILDWGKYLDYSAKGEQDILLGGWVNGTFDAEGVLNPLFYSKISPEGGRRTFYSDKEFDSILDSSRIYDEKLRKERLEKASQKIFEDYAILPLYYPNYSVGIQKNIDGFKGDARGIYDFSQVDFKKK